MTADPACCTKDTPLQDVARMMLDNDCGEIPVVSSKEERKPVGVVTDRDIVVRLLAKGQNVLDKRAGDCMSEPCVTVTPDTSLVDCCGLMETHQIRRVPVVDDNGKLCGIVALADVAEHGGKRTTTELLQGVSQAGPKTH
jgi:CBS domain-containing protein